MRNIFWICSLFLCFACSQNPQPHHLSDLSADTVNLKYARGFKIIKHSQYFEVIVSNPWQGAKNVNIHYYLTRDPTKVKETDGTIIQTPVRKVICLSTTHIAMIDALGETESIQAISGSYLVYHKKILEKLKSKKVFDIGYQDNMNYELILGLKPDVIFAYGVDTEFATYVKKLQAFGFKIVFNAEYLEYEPLAKTEWFKFMSLFYDKFDQASERFDSIAKQYESSKILTSQVKVRPKVLYGLPWNGTWYMAGGRSYAAQIIKDAGGDYLWKDSESHEALPLSIESVIARGDSARIWVNAGAALSRADILAVDKRLADLNVFKIGKIVNNIGVLSPAGGNDYWESGVMNPQVILNDMIKILHPELLPGYNLHYYRTLN